MKVSSLYYKSPIVLAPTVLEQPCLIVSQQKALQYGNETLFLIVFPSHL